MIIREGPIVADLGCLAANSTVLGLRLFALAQLLNIEIVRHCLTAILPATS